jgi:hypothetical protein
MIIVIIGSVALLDLPHSLGTSCLLGGGGSLAGSTSSRLRKECLERLGERGQQRRNFHRQNDRRIALQRPAHRQAACHGWA